MYCKISWKNSNHSCPKKNNYWSKYCRFWKMTRKEWTRIGELSQMMWLFISVYELLAVFECKMWLMGWFYSLHQEKKNYCYWLTIWQNIISELKVTRSVSGTLTHPEATDSTGAHTALMERGLSSQRSSESRNNFGQFKDHVSLNKSFLDDKKQFHPHKVNAGLRRMSFFYVWFCFWPRCFFLALGLIWCPHFLSHAL